MTDSDKRAAFAVLLRQHRRAVGLSQRELARRAGYSPDYVSMLERAVRPPAPATLGSLADALDLMALDRVQFQRAGWPDELAPRLPDGLPASSALIGRSAERDQVAAFVTGVPPALLLLGEVGIGKTRLLEEGRRLAVERNLTTVFASSRPDPSGSAWPYAPLVEALAAHIQALPARRLRAVMRGCEWLVRLIPELRERGFEPPSGSVSAAAERRQIFHAVKRFLTQAAGRERAILILDDLQWATTECLDLVAFLVAKPYRVRLLGAYRPAEVPPLHPIAVLGANLLREGAIELVRISSFQPDASRELLDSLVPGVSLDAERLEA
ncbi:MAG: hypothetical protein QOI23_20, partial [Chloroflexota bacterium]|nr:hypothetical protein [Chloroflexota bacterium]